MADLSRKIRIELNSYDPSWDGFLLFWTCTVEEVKTFYSKAQKEKDDLKAYEFMINFIISKFVSGELNKEVVNKEDLTGLDLLIVQDILETILGTNKKK